MKLLSAAAAISACLLMSGNIMAQNIQIKVDDKAFTGELNNNDAAKKAAPKMLKSVLLSERYGNNRIFEKNDSFNGSCNADDGK